MIAAVCLVLYSYALVLVDWKYQQYCGDSDVRNLQLLLFVSKYLFLHSYAAAAVSEGKYLFYLFYLLW